MKFKLSNIRQAWGIVDAVRDRIEAIEQERGDDGEISVLEVVEHVAKAAQDAAEIINDPKVSQVVNLVAGAVLQVVELLGEPIDDTE